MKTCTSCGKANNPTRKYCLRCGKPLYPEKEPKQAAAPTTQQEKQGVDRAVEQLERVVTPSQPPKATPKVTTDDQWVKPSQVSKDRVRTTSPTTGKSEMEKAREAFARAEQVGIADENGEIVETRMLRASEVQELMEGISKQQDVATQQRPESPQPVQGTPTTNIPKGPPAGASTQHQMPPGAPSPSPSPPKSQVADKQVGIQPSVTTTATPVQSTPITPPPKPPIAEQVSKPTTANGMVSSQLRAPIPELDQIISEITDPDFLQDQTIRETVNDLTNLYKEVKHYEADLSSTSTRLEKDTKECWNKAEVKRIQFESLEEQLRLARQEWTDASKVYQNAEKRRKDEVSSREKHIKDLEKKIGKTEDTIRKRVKDLEKEKEKAEQQ